MSHNKLFKIAFPIVAALVLFLSTLLIFQPKVHAYSGYDDCVAKASKNASKQKEKVINPALDRRIKASQDLQKLVDKNVPRTYNQSVSQGIADDTKLLREAKARIAGGNEATQIQIDFCQTIYKTQVFQFRARQTHWINHAHASTARDFQFQKILNSGGNNNFRNPLRGDAVARYNNAKGLMAANLQAENAGKNQIVGAKVTNYKSNFVKPAYNNVDLRGNYLNGHRQYTEANVIRIAASSLKINRSMKLVSVQLLNSQGKPADGDTRHAVKANVTIKVSGKKGKVKDSTHTKTLERPNGSSSWHVSR